MALQLIEHIDPRSFRDAVIGRLMESEAEYCVHVGLVQRLAENDYRPVSADELDRPLLLTIQDGNRVELVAVQTLKKVMAITRGSPEAMHYLAEALALQQWAGEGFFGPSPAIDALVTRYAELSNRSPRPILRLRTFQLSEVTWPRTVPGSMRLCTRSDRVLLAQFIGAFTAAIGDLSTEDSLSMADRFTDAQRIFFWVDREPVAMAGWGGRTPNGVRILSVYTPPEFRRRGYASALVANLTQRMLDEGRKFCFLLTDLANPTSNSIYQKIGYRGVGDSERWEFGNNIRQ